MSNRRKPKGGRVTPKGGSSGRPGPAARPPTPTPQVGRRPSRPALLFVIAAAWIGCGVVALFALTATWKYIPGVVFIGIGLFYLRGALATVARHEERLQGDDDV